MLIDFQRPELWMSTFGLLLLATVFAGLTSSRIGFPALIGFIGLGMLAGVNGPGGLIFDDYLLSHAVGTVCLAFILFSGGLDTEWRAVRTMMLPALVLATLGVAITGGIITLAGIVFLDFAPLQAFLLGAVVASTDAAAVFAILRANDFDLKTEVPAILELESGSNDPTAIFLVGAGIIFVSTPDASPHSLLPSFVHEMAVGTLVGIGVGFALPLLLKQSALRGSGLKATIKADRFTRL